MTSDEARDLFGDAIEGTLDAAQKNGFEAALAADPELREELEAYRAVIGGAARLATQDDEAAPDLLHGVQSRLRKRSRGRFYRDRFAEQARPRSVVPVLAGILVALMLAAGWVATQSFIVIEGPAQGESPSPADGPATGGQE